LERKIKAPLKLLPTRMSYIKNIFRTGAVTKTPSRIIESILSEIELESAKTVVEFGCGKGEITREILSDTKIKLYGFETNQKFCNNLNREFTEADIFCFNAIVFNEKIPAEINIDYFICSFPLSFYSKAELHAMFSKMKERLANGGKIILLFHASWLIPALKKDFKNLKIKRFFHFPPYYLAVYKS
jgi:phospholipid N-methyltransferase